MQKIPTKTIRFDSISGKNIDETSFISLDVFSEYFQLQDVSPTVRVRSIEHYSAKISKNR